MPSTAPEPTIITLDPNGDVVLVVGSPPTHRITVSLDRLAEVPPVFKSLPLFTTTERQKEVHLGGDDGFAVSTLCNMVYHRQ